MFRRMPSPSALRTFEAAARLGSFKAAAEELFVTPTAVSHQIRSLESQLGIALFVRRTRAVALTESGERLAVALNAAFAQIMSALEEVAAAETVLTVTTTPAFATLWLVPRLADFQELHPEYRVQLDTGTAAVDLRRDRRVHVAIRYGPGQDPDLVEREVARETFGAYAAPGYLSTLSGIEGARLIETAWEQRGLDEVGWSAWLSQAGLDAPAAGIETQRLAQEHYVVQCGIAGQGLILASSLLVHDMVERGFLVPYRPEVRLQGMAYRLLCTRDHAQTRKVQRFTEWLEEHLPGASG